LIGQFSRQLLINMDEEDAPVQPSLTAFATRFFNQYTNTKGSCSDTGGYRF
jgi:hypothetical protein